MSSSIPGENNKRNKFNENEDEIEEDNNLKLKSKLSDQEKDDEEYNVPEEDISDEGTPSSKLEQGLKNMNFEGMMKSHHDETKKKSKFS